MFGKTFSSNLLRGIVGLGTGLLMVVPAALASAATSATAASAATPATSATTGASSTIYGSTVINTDNLTLKTSQFGHMPLVHYYYLGLPPMNAWTSGLGKAVQGSAEIISFDGSPQSVISGADNADLENFFDTAPTTEPIYYVYWHEPEIHVTDGEFTFAQYRAAWAIIVGIADKANNPELFSTLCLLAYDVSPYSGQTWTNYLPAGNIISTLSWDAYPPKGVGTPAPATLMDGVVTASKQAGLPFGWAEFGTTTATGRPAWLSEVAHFAATSGAIFCNLYDAPIEGGLAKSGTYVLSDKASISAWKGVVSGTGMTDIQPPSVPTALTATDVKGSNIYGAKVALSWTASTDNVGVTGYIIYRDGGFVGTSATTSYTDAGLGSDTTHQYSVAGYDAASNVSAASTTASATTLGTEAATTPTNLTVGAVTSSSAAISWTASTAPNGVTGYYIFRNGLEVATSTTASYTASGLSAKTTYHYAVTSYDAAGNLSAETSAVLATTPAS